MVNQKSKKENEIKNIRQVKESKQKIINEKKSCSRNKNYVNSCKINKKNKRKKCNKKHKKKV